MCLLCNLKLTRKYSLKRHINYRHYNQERYQYETCHAVFFRHWLNWFNVQQHQLGYIDAAARWGHWLKQLRIASETQLTQQYNNTMLNCWILDNVTSLSRITTKKQINRQCTLMYNITYLLILILLNYFTLAPLLQQNHSLHPTTC